MGRKKLPPDQKRTVWEVSLTLAERNTICSRFGTLTKALRALAAHQPTVGPADDPDPTPQLPEPTRVEVKKPVAAPHCDAHRFHIPNCPRCHHARWGEWPAGHKP